MTEEYKPLKLKSKLQRVGIFLLRAGLFFILLVAVMLLLIQTSPVQNLLVKKASVYLEKKLKTNIDVRRVYFSFPKTVVLENLFIEDLKKDTLVYAGKVRLKMSILGLFSGDIEMTEIKLEKTTAKLNRLLADTVFNYQFILDA